jgi:hypothetical protein
MTWVQLINFAIDTAVAGTDANNNPIIKQRLQAAGMTDQALQALATMVAGDPELRARLEKEFTVALTSGVGAIPAGMLIEYLREGVVRDSSGSGVGGLGNILARVNRYSNFISDQDTALGLYCPVDNSIYARPPGSTYPSDTIGPLIINAPFTPTTADLDTTVPDELTNDLVAKLARLLRGMILEPEPA